MRGMDATKRFVYLLQSESQPSRYYTGLTANVQTRLRAHNEGRSRHTASSGPWRVIVALEFADEAHAVAFERYLKSGSGCAFSKRHFR